MKIPLRIDVDIARHGIREMDTVPHGGRRLKASSFSGAQLTYEPHASLPLGAGSM